MGLDDERAHETVPTVKSPLDRGDFASIPNTLLKPPENLSVDTKGENLYSDESDINIITIYDSKPSSDYTSSEKLSHPNNQQEGGICCVCQAAWSHWNGELLKRAKTPAPVENMEKNNLLRNNSESACRICLEERGEEEFISPCDCAGTMGKVHRSCLEQWLSLLNSSECEICRHKFKVHRYLRPARQFQFHRLPVDVCGDMICIAVLSPLCVLIIYFTVDTSMTNIKKGKQAGAIALIIVASTVVIMYFLWLFCTLKHALRYWWGCNRIVRLSNNQVVPRQIPRTDEQ